jgi:triosephosphate isomerase
MTPIFCIGETMRDDEGHYLSVIREQLEKGLAGITKAWA